MAINPNNTFLLHPRNKHKNGYDFGRLVAAHPSLANHIKTKYGKDTIDFDNPESVKALNLALLITHYNITAWDIPEGHLCPPIPGRADYIHHLSDLLSQNPNGKVPRGKSIRILDIGTGANVIYPLLGHSIYRWSFVATDIDQASIKCAEKNIISLSNHNIQLRIQNNKDHIFKNIITADERFDATMCNPPFYASQEEAKAINLQKSKALKGQSSQTSNFGGTNNELWYPGGELAFIRSMIQESKTYVTSCHWFTSLVSDKKNLDPIYKMLKQEKAANVKTIEMAQGQKKSRFVAWTFLTPKQQTLWAASRWI